MLNYNNIIKEGKTRFELEEDISHIVEQVYNKIFNKEVPSNYKIALLPQKRLDSAYEEVYKEKSNCGGTIFIDKEDGKYTSAVSEESLFAEIVLKVLHEFAHLERIGEKHYNTNELYGKIAEETRAYSFQNLCTSIIKKYNIGNLGYKIESANKKILDEPNEIKAGGHYFATKLVKHYEEENSGKLYNLLKNGLPNYKNKVYSLLTEANLKEDLDSYKTKSKNTMKNFFKERFSRII